MCKHRYSRPTELPLVTCFLELAIACRVNLPLASREHILGRHIADGAVQTHGVVMFHLGLNQVQRIFSRQWCAGPDALGF